MLERFRDLGHARIAAGLEDGCRHCNGPNTGLKQLLNVEIIRAAGIGEAELPAEFPGHAGGHFDCEQVERPARHVHFFAWQFVCLNIHREGVGKLQTEFQPMLCGERSKAAEHGNGVPVLQVFPEMVIVKGNIAIAGRIERFARKVIAEDGRVAFNEGVEPLFTDEVRSDRFDFLRRAAVQGGNRHPCADVRGDTLDVVCVLREGGKRVLHASLPDSRCGGIL